eukprot:jgi/Psemu1/15981/gm1.15981_g
MSVRLYGWTLHYQNRVPEEDTPSFSPRYTSSRDLFPQERKGKLDMAKLRKHGLQLGRVLDSDALFFYQLLLPFHTDEEDKKQANETWQKPFYSKVLKWSNNYANQANTGKGHYARRIRLSELVHFDGIIYLHGALEGKKGKIATKMSWYWWRQIKSNLKLNCNHEAKYNRLLCKDDMSKFNYAHKFDYIYETLVHNVHYFSKKACSDLCMDELSWAHWFGGPMVDYLKGKIFSRGGQTVILSDDIFTKYVIPEIGKLWSSPPHPTPDNFFNRDLILGWMGGLGFGMIGTVAQNRLPKTVEKKYFHKEMYHLHLAKGVRALPDSLAGLERGTGVSIAHSRAQELAILVLSTVLIQMVSSYARKSPDQIDSAILRSNIGYKSWKHCHAQINHAKALAVLTAFDMYQELTDGLSSGRATQRSDLVFNKAKAGAE